MKVLLIGGAGYIGSYAAFYLQEAGMDVVILDRKSYRGPVNYCYGDITDINAVLAAGHDADCIVILAGVVGDPACAADPLKASHVNNTAVKSICEVFSHRHIIFFSSCSVYGAQDGLLSEDSRVDPISVYAKTKLAAEAHVMAVGGTIFRLASVYGVGFSDTMRMDSIVNFLVKTAIYEGRITILGGQQWKSLISVKDVRGFLQEAIQREIRGLFNISNKNYTVRRIGREIVECIPDTKIIFKPALPNDRNYRVDNCKRESEFYYIPEHSLIKEIYELADFFKRQLKEQNYV